VIELLPSILNCPSSICN
jgi:hypothetical protein